MYDERVSSHGPIQEKSSSSAEQALNILNTKMTNVLERKSVCLFSCEEKKRQKDSMKKLANRKVCEILFHRSDNKCMLNNFQKMSYGIYYNKFKYAKT